MLMRITGSLSTIRMRDLARKRVECAGKKLFAQETATEQECDPAPASNTLDSQFFMGCPGQAAINSGTKTGNKWRLEQSNWQSLWFPGDPPTAPVAPGLTGEKSFVIPARMRGVYSKDIAPTIAILA